QLAPGAPSETLAIISLRTGLAAPGLRALADSADQLNARLWAHVSRAALAETEARMDDTAREQVTVYLGGAG
ncbi:MAG TPA: hypothetical protein VER79_12950, partial [Candidatus Limnocylindrales bacterium]|nr:hypothetical protein [Candidatus Limnocylindrales bacterium]